MATGGLSAFGWGIAAGGAAIAAVAGGLYFTGILKTKSLPVETAAVVQQTELDPGPEPEAKPDPSPSEPVTAAASLDAPSFDVVRVEPDGSTLVAGTSPAGSRVLILLDDAVQHTQDVDGAGKFVSFLTLPTSDVPRILTLVAEHEGNTTQSEDQIILAPTPRVAPAPADQLALADPSTPEPEPKTNVTAPEATADPVSEPVQATPVEPAAEPAQPTSPASDDQAPAPVAETQSAQTQMSEPTIPVVTAPADPQSDNIETAVNGATQDDPAATATAPAAPVETTADVPPTQLAAVPEPVAEAPQTAQIAALAETPQPGTLSNAVEPTVQAAPTPTPAPVAVLRAGPDGVELLQPIVNEAPSARFKIVLDTISYSETGEVLLSGQSRENSLVRVYLDNAAIADLQAGDDGRWQGQVAGITPGVYTLRLDELDNTGSVLSRLETPFKRETPEVLNPPVTGTGERSAPIRAVTVQTGDTLWAISRERYGDGVLYVRLFDANRDHIRDPDLIYPGQVFAIPE